jgi:hypothetical protein
MWQKAQCEWEAPVRRACNRGFGEWRERASRVNSPPPLGEITPSFGASAEACGEGGSGDRGAPRVSAPGGCAGAEPPA